MGEIPIGAIIPCLLAEGVVRCPVFANLSFLSYLEVSCNTWDLRYPNTSQAFNILIHSGALGSHSLLVSGIMSSCLLLS